MKTNYIEGNAAGGMSFVGPKAVDVFKATVIASGLRLYAKTGMKPNRNYTPKNMMYHAALMTGLKFKARDYEGAAAALTAWARQSAAEVHQESAAE